MALSLSPLGFLRRTDNQHVVNLTTVIKQFSRRLAAPVHGPQVAYQLDYDLGVRRQERLVLALAALVGNLGAGGLDRQLALPGPDISS